MAEKKLSDELSRCLEDDACGDCQYHKPETKFICKGLLQKAYEVVKRYEEMFPCKVGDKIFIIVKKDISRQIVKKIIIKEGFVEIETNKRTFNKTYFGKTVFLTRQEAEDKLAEMEEQQCLRTSDST